MKTPLLLLAVIAAAATAGWFAGSRSHSGAAGSSRPVGERRIRFYQSPMHPWIRSDQPGKCTICGMSLTPVHEGDAELGTEAGLIALSSNQVTVIQVATAAAVRSPIRRTLHVAGTIEDNDQRHRFLSAYVDGRVDRLHVNELGAEVVAGQPLAAIYSPPLLTAVREYLVARSAGADLARTAALRLRQLGLTDGQVAALPETFLPDTLTVDLVAPTSGTVVAKDIYEGQYVKEGTRLFELADFRSMWFQFDAYERDLAWLRPGQEVEVTAPSLPGLTLTNVIAFIDPNLRDATRSARVRVELPNPLITDAGQERRLIRHRVYADGKVRLATEPVLVVPRPAVLSPGGRSVVYVERGNGAYEQRAVTLGRAGDDLWEITGGLAEGERVVTAGNLLLDSQAQLNVSAAPHATPPPAAPVSPAQAAAARDFLQLADRLRDTLAGDDLSAFNALAPRLHAAEPALAAAFADAGGWSDALARLATASHLEPADSLESARRQFHTFSEATVGFARRIRSSEGFGDLRIFRCPMTAKAFPGAPAKAEWLQLSPVVRNPYFGADMLDCGTEVAP